MRMVDSYQVEILLTIALALGGYVLADRLLVSGPLEAVAAAIALRHFNRKHKHKQIAHESIDRFWEVIDEVQNSVLFVLLGLEVLAISFRLSSFESGALAIVLVTAIRLGVVAAIVGLVRLLQRGHSSSILTLSWGGLRGGLSIALALAVPAGDGRAWILATTYRSSFKVAPWTGSCAATGSLPPRKLRRSPLTANRRLATSRPSSRFG